METEFKAFNFAVFCECIKARGRVALVTADDFTSEETLAFLVETFVKFRQQFVSCDKVATIRINEAKAERDAWKNVAEVRSKLLACYRLGSHPSETLMKKLDKAQVAIAALTKESTDAR